MDRVRTPVPGRDDYFAAWSVTHGDYVPARGSVIVRLWLGFAYQMARPLAAVGVPPAAVTVAGVAVTALALPAAAAGGRWGLVAALVVVASGLLDNLDGAVAILTRRVSAAGFVLDSVADRAADLLYLLALWLLGAPGGLVVGAGIALWALEYTRARAGNAGFGEIGVVTVGERPTRIILTAAGLGVAGVVPSRGADCAVAAVAAVLAVSVVGLGQLAVVLRRELGARGAGRSGRADQVGDDPGRQRDEGQPPAGVRGAADEEQARDR